MTIIFKFYYYDYYNQRGVKSYNSFTFTILILPVYSLIVHLIEQQHTELVDYMFQTLHFTKHIIQTYKQYNKAIKKG